MELKNTILSLFERSWGEVDWILPVLFQLKRLKPDWRLIIIFSEEWRKYNPVLMCRTLHNELVKVADEIVYFEKGSISIPGLESAEQVKIIIKDNGNDAPFKVAIQKTFPLAKIVTHQHGTTEVFGQKYNHPRNFNEWEKISFKHDLALICKQIEAKYFYDIIANAKFGVVGFPRYDKWWIKKLLESQELEESVEAKTAKLHQRVFLFNSRWITREAPADVIDYVTRSVAEIVLSDKRNFLLIKPHPRENLSLLTSYFNKYDSNRWMVSNLHTTQLAYLSDFVISVWTSVTNDVLSVGKPVVEFYRFIPPNSTYEVDKEGRFTSVSRLLGLVVPADNKDEVISHINNYFNPDADHTIWKRQQDAFRNLCPPNDNASYRAARLILSLVDPGIDKKDLPFIQSAGTPITGEKVIFLEKNESGQPSLNFQLKRIKACGMPISSILLQEIALIFGSETFIITGTFNEHIALEAAKIFREVHIVELAADLYQIPTMNEIMPFNNIRIYHSANILKGIVSNLKSKIMFFLSTHESAGISTKSRTNTPIIEELKAIRESNINDAVIIVNNIRYFHPIAINEHEAQTKRKYPSLQETMDAIFEINPKYNFVVLGDIAMAYLPEYPVKVAPSIHSCTISRAFYNDNSKLNSVLEAENYIAFNLSDNEKQTIQMMYDDYFSFEEPGICGYFRLWRGLTFLGEKRFDAAKEDFFNAYKLGCEHWRILWYLAKSAQLAGDIDLAKEAIQVVINTVPHYKPAISLYKQIGT
jgi:hypothetical protein